MIRFLFYILLAGFFLSSCTQKSSNEVHSATNDSVKKYLDLAWDETIPFDKRIKYNDKLYSMIDLSKNDTITRFYLYNVSYLNYIFSINDKHRLTAQKLMDLSLKYGSATILQNQQGKNCI